MFLCSLRISLHHREEAHLIVEVRIVGMNLNYTLQHPQNPPIEQNLLSFQSLPSPFSSSSTTHSPSFSIRTHSPSGFFSISGTGAPMVTLLFSLTGTHSPLSFFQLRNWKTTSRTPGTLFTFFSNEWRVFLMKSWLFISRVSSFLLW